MLPDFLVLGFPKTGTTSLDDTFRKHPEICLPLQKETRFFDENFGEGISWYKDKFWHCSQESVVGEVTTATMLEKDFAAKLKQVLPGGKFIVLLRDPIERSISHYYHNVRIGVETEPIDVAIELEQERISSDKYIFGTFAYTGIGMRYSSCIRELFSLFSKDQIKIIFFEELIKNQEIVVKDLYRFIGVTELEQKLSRKNVARMPKLKGINQLIEYPNSLLTGLYSSVIMQRIIPQSLKRNTRRLRVQISNAISSTSNVFSKEFKKPDIPPYLRTQLVEKYNSSLSDLQELSGKNVSSYWHWFKSEKGNSSYCAGKNEKTD